jgi:hypothetical protein
VKALAKRLLFCWTCTQLVVVICPVTSREKIEVSAWYFAACSIKLLINKDWCIILPNISFILGDYFSNKKGYLLKQKAFWNLFVAKYNIRT